jgi:hypothetical protein
MENEWKASLHHLMRAGIILNVIILICSRTVRRKLQLLYCTVRTVQ